MPGTFRDRVLSMFMKDHKEKTQKQILYNINAILPPGSLIAILGTSGSGNYSRFSCDKEFFF